MLTKIKTNVDPSLHSGGGVFEKMLDELFIWYEKNELQWQKSFSEIQCQQSFFRRIAQKITRCEKKKLLIKLPNLTVFYTIINKLEQILNELVTNPIDRWEMLVRIPVV